MGSRTHSWREQFECVGFCRETIRLGKRTSTIRLLPWIFRGDHAGRPESLFLERFFSRELFRKDFNKKSFVFHHDLHTQPLLSMPALRELATKMGKSEASWLCQVVRMSARPALGQRRIPECTEESIRKLETSQMRMKLSSIHSEREHGEILNQCARELTERSDIYRLVTGFPRPSNYID